MEVGEFVALVGVTTTYQSCREGTLRIAEAKLKYEEAWSRLFGLVTPDSREWRKLDRLKQESRPTWNEQTGSDYADPADARLFAIIVKAAYELADTKPNPEVQGWLDENLAPATPSPAPPAPPAPAQDPSPKTPDSTTAPRPKTGQLMVGMLVAIVIFAVVVAVLTWAANQLTGAALLIVLVMALLFVLLSIIFLLVFGGIVSSEQALAFFGKVLEKVPGLGTFIKPE